VGVQVENPILKLILISPVCVEKEERNSNIREKKFEVSFISEEEEDEGAFGKGKNESSDTAFTTFFNRIRSHSTHR